MTSVAILGGGVGGLSAAHELGKRGFDVTVYETRAEFGGKARSIPIPGTETFATKPLPGEHGFRFFPGFYQHLDVTMSEIPFGGRTVKDNLTPATEMLMAQAGGRNELIAPMELPSTFGDLERLARFVHEFSQQVQIPLFEYVLFFNRILDYLSSCDERRLAEFESQSWWEFVEADKRSPEYQKFLATGMTRTLVAAQAKEMSAKTGCAILCQLMQDMARIDGQVDRVLNGPTSEVWIDPWVDHLRTEYGVTLAGGHEVVGIDCVDGRITGATVESDGGRHTVTADFYVAAMPVERFATLLTADLVAAEPRLGALAHLVTRSMNGAMFYLDEDVKLVRGHAIFIDSEWALTAISQQQFWSMDLQSRGDGRVEGILSVDVSDWDTAGSNGKPAKACTETEILDEVWAQIVAHVDDSGLVEANVLHRFLDPAIRFDEKAGAVRNEEPLLINTAGSWVNRPEAVTAIPNLFLAADFVRTNTDLATMEGANEAARRAVNALLDAAHSHDDRCAVFDLAEPALLAPFRAVDAVLWKLGRRGPKKASISVNEDGGLEVAELFR